MGPFLFASDIVAWKFTMCYIECYIEAADGSGRPNVIVTSFSLKLWDNDDYSYAKIEWTNRRSSTNRDTNLPF